MISFLNSLVLLGRFESVTFYFPVPGHSWMPCDSDFGKIERKRKKREKVLVPSAWTEMVKEAQNNPPFRFVFVEHPLTDNLEDNGTPIVRVKNFKAFMDPYIKSVEGITAIRTLKLSSKGVFATKSMTAEPNGEIELLKKEIS